MASTTRRARLPLLTSLIIGLAVFFVSGNAAAERPYLGISMSPLTPSMARAVKLEEGIGVLVDRVVIGSPADRAGLQSGDVILEIGDRSITGTRELSRTLGAYKPGEELKLRIHRDGKQRHLKVVVGERPKRKVDTPGGFFDGIDFLNWLEGDQEGFSATLREQMTRLTRGYLGIVLDETFKPEGPKKGALISEVNPGSPAEQAGIQSGDVIVEFNQNAIDDHVALHKLLDETKPGTTVELRIERNTTLQDVTVELAGIAERLGLNELVQRFHSRDPSIAAPPSPPRPPRPGPLPSRRSTPRELEEAHVELKELREDLDELKEQLRKLREELGQRR